MITPKFFTILESGTTVPCYQIYASPNEVSNVIHMISHVSHVTKTPHPRNTEDSRKHGWRIDRLHVNFV